ncbi:MAG: chorismate--pyruvate lyase [Lachnospiraceae bacterium]|nr:chorismate--pyruvate lyase [Lachnospiraceae bacterium]
METKYYIVNRIDGDYAYLLLEDGSVTEEKCVARALLPAEIAEGLRLAYECFQYSIVD